MTEPIAITVDDQPLQATPATSVASAVMQRSLTLRQSINGEARGPLCGMGICFECRVTINGRPHQRSCQTLCTPGMRIETQRTTLTNTSTPRSTVAPLEFDVLIVGAGPAGLAAASSAADAGLRIGIVDDNPRAGGQIWRHDVAKSPSPPLATALSAVQRPAITHLHQTQVIAAPVENTLLAESPIGLHLLRYHHLILACGARERFLPFPGWTLPGVFGAGGLQALVKAGYPLFEPVQFAPVKRLRVVVAGSGPLLPAVGAYFHRRGARICDVLEQAPLRKLWSLGHWLMRYQSSKVLEALGFGLQFGITPYCWGRWPVRAHGTNRLEAVTLNDGRTLPCDALACGFGLVPNLELPMLVGCAIEDGFVRVNEEQRTSLPNVYAIGEITGIGGLDKAILEGQIAAAVIAGRSVRQFQRPRAKAWAFVRQLADSFALRDELRQLPEQDTIVCRCEDVTFGQLQRRASWRDAKLQTRCGMGPCQGRICGPAVEFLFGWNSDSVRPPIFPTALGNLAAKS